MNMSSTEPRQQQPERSQTTKKREKKASFFLRVFHDVLGGEFLAHKWSYRQMPFLLFIAGLSFIYIANIYYSETTVRQIDKTFREIKELQFEYTYVKSAVLFESKQTELARKLQTRGLKESVDPVIKIVTPQTARP